MKRSNLRRAAALALAAGLALQPLAYATAAYAEDAAVSAEASTTEAVQTVTMERLYNRWTGEHLYTSSAEEVKTCVKNGWRDEGRAWVAPATSSTPVYRLYNRWSGDHHYTTSKYEYEKCAERGWTKEGVAWYSADSKSVPLYRGYNPYEAVGTHHYTASSDEMSAMTKNGWRAEGVAWYGLKWVEGTAAWDEPVYGTRSYVRCSKCHATFYDDEVGDALEAFDRHCEEVHSQEGDWCETCGAAWPDTEKGWQAAKKHSQEHPDHGVYSLSYSNGDEKVQTGTVHHAAVEGHWE